MKGNVIEVLVFRLQKPLAETGADLFLNRRGDELREVFAVSATLLHVIGARELLISCFHLFVFLFGVGFRLKFGRAFLLFALGLPCLPRKHRTSPELELRLAATGEGRLADCSRVRSAWDTGPSPAAIRLVAGRCMRILPVFLDCMLRCP